MPKPTSRQTGLLLFAIVCLMVALAYAAVPLYSIFCKATGFGGTPRRVEALPNAAGRVISDKFVTVSFNADVNGGLPWDFAPAVQSLRVRLGEPTLVTFKVHNRGSVSLTGTAVFNVQPDRAGQFFSKIQCFCFTEQTLAPDESKELPVQFFVDPALADDPKYADVTNITLSYTFYRAKTDPQPVAP